MDEIWCFKSRSHQQRSCILSARDADGWCNLQWLPSCPRSPSLPWQEVLQLKLPCVFGKVGKQRTNDKISSWWWNFWVCWWSEIAQCSWESWDYHTSLKKEQKHVYKSGPVQSPSCNLPYMDHVGIYQFHHESRWISSWKFPRKNSWQSCTRRVPLLSYLSTKKTTCGAQIVAPLQGFLLGSWLRASFNCTETKRSSRPTRVKSKTWTEWSHLSYTDTKLAKIVWCRSKGMYICKYFIIYKLYKHLEALRHEHYGSISNINHTNLCWKEQVFSWEGHSWLVFEWSNTPSNIMQHVHTYTL